jgi:tetratricopeptide (TPR) repeat protein
MTRIRRTTLLGRWLARATLAGALVCGPLATAAWAITPENVIQMHKSGLPAQVIIQTIQSTGSTFNLSVDDVKALNAAGVPQPVIDAMTASASAAPAPEPAPEPAPAPAPAEGDEIQQLQQAEDAERAQIEENIRIREAARKAAERERQRMDAEERGRIARALEEARNAFEDGRYATAAQAFDTFLSQAEEGKPSTNEARLGLADSLFRLGFFANAAEIYQSLLATGPDSTVFEAAFNGLRECARKIAFNPVTLESLTGHYVGDKGQPFQDSYNYFVGRFFFDYNRYDEAVTYLGTVTASGPDYADAQYLLGLIGVQQAGDEQDDEWARKLFAASSNFEQAVDAAQRQDQPRIAHLGYLALARIAYTVGLFDVAIYYYRKVPYDSTSYVNALHESGWSYFLKGDVARGMGIFHTLDGPDWENYFLPDIHLLEATVFMNACHFGHSRDALERIQNDYLSLRVPLTRYMTEYASPEALYNAFVLKQTNQGVELPRVLRMAVISSSEFYDLYTTVTQYRREVARLGSMRTELGDALATKLLDTVSSRTQEGVIALGIKTNQLLQQISDELDELDVQVTEIRIEIEEDAANQITQDIEQAYQGETEALEEAEAQATATVLVGDKYVTWPFEGEYWTDEINSYRSDLKDICKR